MGPITNYPPKAGKVPVKDAEAERLKEYMQENFWFAGLKKAGVFPKEMRFNDYAGQATIICRVFSLESIYDYSNIGRGCYAHISYANPTPFDRFVEPIGPPLMQVVDMTAKIIPFI
jgi:hypothetical protein